MVLGAARLWADIYNAAGVRQGEGPVALRDAAVKRVLDGVGSVSVTIPGTDTRALALVGNEARIRVYYRPTDEGETRELGRGVVRKLKTAGTTDEWVMVADGPDDLDALTRRSVLLGRKYSAKTVSEIATALIALVGGWSVSASGGNTTDARFDGMSVWKALLGIAEQQGLHVRAGTSAETVEVGAFGSDSGLRLVNPAQAHHAMYSNDDIALIDSIQVEKNSEAVCNRVYALGAGIGEAWLTLAESTRNSPYTIESTTGPDGTTLYYLQDFDSITAFGYIEKVGKFSQVAPLSNSVADLENAANALYDVASNWLTRYAQRQDVYNVTCRKVRATVRPGDKVRMVYKGVVERDGAVVEYLDLDDDFWVMEVTETVGVEGSSLDLKLSTVDRHELDSVQMVIGALEEIYVDGVSVKPYFNRLAWVYDRLIDATVPATVPVKFSNATQRLNRCLLQIKTRPFTSTARTIVEGDDHLHFMFADGGEHNGPYTWETIALFSPQINEGAGGFVFARILIDKDGEEDVLPITTGEVSEEGIITIDYGLEADTETPDTISIFIDGTDYTSALGGPWAGGGGATTINLDITAQILANPPLQSEHLVRLECGSGQGEVEVTVEVYETIQSIAVV